MNFSMWKKALQVIPSVTKDEWDALDIISLLLDNEVGITDDTINMERIARLCLKDWGLYKTLTINLSKVESVLVNENPGLSDEDTQRVLERINTIRRILDRAAIGKAVQINA